MSETQVWSEPSNLEKLSKITNQFNFYPNREELYVDYEEIERKSKELAIAISNRTKLSRLQSLALTNLETATLYAYKAITEDYVLQK